MTTTFTCNMCAQVFNTQPDWTDEDAFNEAVDSFGVVAFEDKMLPVCEQCYATFMTYAKAMGLV